MDKDSMEFTMEGARVLLEAVHEYCGMADKNAAVSVDKLIDIEKILSCAVALFACNIAVQNEKDTPFVEAKRIIGGYGEASELFSSMFLSALEDKGYAEVMYREAQNLNNKQRH